MNEKLAKSLLITINVIVMMSGIAMFVGGILLEYTTNGKYILQSLNSNITSSQLGAIGVVLISIGALLVLVSFVGCCGSVYESTCLLSLYFIFVLILFLCQIGVVIAAFVLGSGRFFDTINNQFSIYVRGYNSQSSSTQNAVVDTVQQFFQCCGSNGPNDYTRQTSVSATTASMNTTPSMNTITSVNTTTPMNTITSVNTTTPMNTSITANETYYTGNWPASCCKPGVNQTMCRDNSLPASVLQDYLNTQGCTSSIEAWVQSNLIIIGGVALGIALIELFSLCLACSLRSSLD